MGGPAQQADAPLSTGLAIAAVLKGTIGAGILTLPFVFAKVKLLLAVPGMVLLALVNMLGVWYVIECKKILADSADYSSDSSADTEHESERIKGNGFQTNICTSKAGKDYGLGPMASVANSIFGLPGVVVTGVGILGTQLGVLIAYCDVIFETTKKMIHLPDLILRLSLLGILCVLGLVRQLGVLAKFSAVALLIYIVVALFLIYFGSLEMVASNHPPSNKWVPIQLDGFEVWYGTCIFAFEGIVTAQYVYNDMRLPRGEESKFKSVLVVSYFVILSVYGFVGFFGYTAYGSDVADVIYLNFPNPFRNIATIILILVLLISFMLQVYPIFIFLEDVVVSPKADQVPLDDEDECSDAYKEEASEDAEGNQMESLSKHSKVYKQLASCTIRIVTITLINLAAGAMPHISKITGLTGSVFMSLIAFILPAIFHARVKRCNLTPIEWAVDVVLFVCGVVAMAVGLKAGFVD